MESPQGESVIIFTMLSGLAFDRFKAVLFDVDGTLVDSLDMITAGLGDAFEKYGTHRPSNDEIRATIGTPLTSQMLQHQATKPSEEKLAEMINYTMQRYYANVHLEREFGPAVESLFRCHRGGLRTALVTSKNAHELSSFLKRFRGAEAVHVTVCASDVEHPKPAPDAALLACKKLGVEPNEAVMIGDSVFDIRCGRQAGAATVAVLYGSGQRNDLLAEQPDLVIETPEELLHWIEQGLIAQCPERK